jgi:hypothetical protein
VHAAGHTPSLVHLRERPGETLNRWLAHKRSGQPASAKASQLALEALQDSLNDFIRCNRGAHAGEVRLTTVLRQGESTVHNLKRERYLALACSTLVRLHLHTLTLRVNIE